MSVSKVSKVGCIFPVVIWPEDRMEQYRDDDHLEDAPHFTESIQRLDSNLIISFFGTCDFMKTFFRSQFVEQKSSTWWTHLEINI